MNKMFFVAFMALFFCITACKSDYDKLVETEMASGVVLDSLVFNMHMGQTKKEFFGICWQLNADKIVSHGPGTSVMYSDPEDSTKDNSKRKDMLFYGIFDDKEIMTGMNMSYSYRAYAPWNKERNSVALAQELVIEYEKYYPKNPFITIDLDEIQFDAFVKVDGNRRILIYPFSDKDVRVRIEDLRSKLAKKND